MEPDDLYIGHSKRTGPEPRDMRSNELHNSYEIYFILSGKRKYFISDRTYPIGQGDLIFINRNVLHRTMDYEDINHESMVVVFTREFVLGKDNRNIYANLLPDSSRIGNVFKLNSEEQRIVQSLFARMEKEYKQKSDLYQECLQLLLLELVILLNRLYLGNRQYLHHTANVHYEKVQNVVQYVTVNYREPLNLSDLSQRFFISPGYLCKLFREVTGYSVIEYVNWVRIRESQALLSNEQLSMEEIAYLIGFNSHTHFGRTFKNLLGTSPLQYRKGMKTKQDL